MVRDSRGLVSGVYKKSSFNSGYVLDDVSWSKLVGWFEKLGVRLHWGQSWFLRRRYRSKFLVCGRRWGKSLTLALEIALHHLELVRQGIQPRVRLVAPRHDQIREVVNYLRMICDAFDIPFKDRTRDTSDPRVYFGAHRVDTRVGVEGKAHRSAWASLLCIDEARDVDPEVFYTAMLPMLKDVDGSLVIASSAAGKNWFVNEAESLGLQPYYGEFSLEGDPSSLFYTSVADNACWVQSPSWANPNISVDSLLRDRARVPEMVFQQEYGAAILLQHSHPFPTMPNVYKELPREVREYHLSFMGCDYGYHDPFCALWIYKDCEGNYWVEHELYESRWTPEEQARAMIRVGVEPGTTISADKSLFAETGYDTAIHIWQNEFESANIEAHWHVPSNHRKNGLVLLRSLFANGKVNINERCVNLWREIQNAKPKRTDPEDIEKPDHAIMALIYGLEAAEPYNLPNRYALKDPYTSQRIIQEMIEKQRQRYIEEEESSQTVWDASLEPKRTYAEYWLEHDWEANQVWRD